LLEPESEIELKPVKWVQNGYVLARTEEGFPIFVRGALPGETVLTRIIKVRSVHAFGMARSIREASLERTPSDCPVFPECGGCSLRHISYETEQELKRSLLAEFPNLPGRVSGFVWEEYFSSPQGYRTQVQIQRDESGAAGFFMEHGNRVIPLPDEGCRHLPVAMNEALRAALDGMPPPRKREKISFRWTGESLLGPGDLTPDSWTVRRIGESGEFSWGFSGDGFIQGNSFLLAPWLNYIRGLVPEGRPRTVELFAGSGLIGGFCRDLLGEYSGFESQAGAVRAARRNFKEKGWTGDFTQSDLYRQAPALKGVELALVNPPRAGLKEKLCRALAEVPRVIYSSCNPATLNRDLGLLNRAGLETWAGALFDFFPRTPHLELVVSLRRGSASFREEIQR